MDECDVGVVGGAELDWVTGVGEVDGVPAGTLELLLCCSVDWFRLRRLKKALS